MAQHPHTDRITELRLVASDIRRAEKKLTEFHQRRDALIRDDIGIADRLVAAAAGVSRARVYQIKEAGK